MFTLWAILYKDMQTPMEIVNEDIKKMVAAYAPTSSHFYLLVDALWEQVINFFNDFLKFVFVASILKYTSTRKIISNYQHLIVH